MCKIISFSDDDDERVVYCRTGFTPVSSIPQLCLSKYFVWFSSDNHIFQQDRILPVQLFCTHDQYVQRPSKILAFPFRTSYVFVFSKLLQNLRKLHVMVWCCMARLPKTQPYVPTVRHGKKRTSLTVDLPK